MNKTYGLDIQNIEAVEDDPPDCTAELAGRTITIELTELLSSGVLTSLARTRRQGSKNTNAETTAAKAQWTFENARWTKEKFQRRVNEELDKKDKRYAGRCPPVSCDVLVMHTDEYWLLPSEIAEWLEEIEFAKRQSFRSAFLLCSYDPDHPDCWPIFVLYGDPELTFFDHGFETSPNTSCGQNGPKSRHAKPPRSGRA